jgi:hypothetical protein
MRKIFLCVALAFASASISHSAEMRSGREVDPDRSLSIEASYGFVQNLEGKITETKRAYSDGKGPSSFSRYLENYDFEELGFDDDYTAIGVRLQKKWKYFTVGASAHYTKLEASGRAEREPFALGVGGISFQGKDYDYMLIEEGQKYDAEIQTGIFMFSLDWTPFHIVSEERWITFTPWLHLGLLGVLGHYDIDAGPAKGVTTYEFHPYDYVVNGSADGFNGGAVPDIGFGGELKLGVMPMEERMMNLVLQAQYFFLDMDTSLGSFGIDSRNDKDISVDYSGIELNAVLEIPLNETRDLLLGLRYRHTEADVDVEAKRRSQEVQDDRKEKYDKAATLEFDTLFLTVGVTL